MEPTRYIAFLGGINVGGRTVKMERLRAAFEELGFTRVGSYIQSGNVFFDSPEPDRSVLTETIEAHLRHALGYEVPALLRTISEVEAMLASDPFRGIEVTPDVRLCVTFVSEPLPETVEFPLRSPKGDLEVVGATSGEVFVVWHLIDGRPPNSSSWGKLFKPRAATTRFFHTTAKILAAAIKE